MKKFFLPLLMLTVVFLATCNRNTEQNATDTATKTKTEYTDEQRAARAAEKGDASPTDRIAKRYESVGLTANQLAKIDNMLTTMGFADMGREEKKAAMQQINRDIFANILTPEQQAILKAERETRRQEEGGNGGGGKK